MGFHKPFSFLAFFSVAGEKRPEQGLVSLAMI